MFSELCSRSPSKIFFMKFNTIIDSFSEGIIGLAKSVLESTILNDISGNGWPVGWETRVGGGIYKAESHFTVVFKRSKQTFVLFGLHCRFLIND